MVKLNNKKNEENLNGAAEDEMSMSGMASSATEAGADAGRGAGARVAQGGATSMDAGQEAGAGASAGAVGQLQGQIQELTADLQRTRADFENFRKQVELQKENERRAAKFATVYKTLGLLDDLDLAIRSYAELAPLMKSLEKTLKELGLTRILSDGGVEFNPDLHEAVMVEGEGEKEVIAETLRPGYYYEAEVLRPAMVKVKRV